MSKVDTIIATAQRELGKPYVFDTAGPNTFDCSGLITFLFAQVGISLPHNAAEQQRVTIRVTKPLPGDLVFFGDPAYHVGLYVGGGKMISAPHAGAVVHTTDVGTPTSYGRVAGLGAAAAPVLAALTTPVGWVSDVLGPVRDVVYQLAAAAFGAALVGVGLYRTVGARIGSQVTEVLG